MALVGIILLLVVIVAIWYVATSNKLNRCIVKIEEADSGIDVALTKRYDVLTKMIAVCKGYAKHEKETITDTIKYRKGMSMEERVEANRTALSGKRIPSGSCSYCASSKEIRKRSSR